MKHQQLVKISKYLSRHLRHKPHKLGLTLGPGGWVSVDELLAACQKYNFPLTCDELEEVVNNNDKKRFSFDETGSLIRANQGHSVAVDLQLQPLVPPDVLYHGTGEQVVSLILEEGLQKMCRHHVHLSKDTMTAFKVGKRKSKSVVLQINSAVMYQDGYQFFCSDNGVWLVEYVPSKYLEVIPLP